MDTDQGDQSRSASGITSHGLWLITPLLLLSSGLWDTLALYEDNLVLSSIPQPVHRAPYTLEHFASS